MIFFPFFFREKPTRPPVRTLDIQITEAQIETNKIQIELNAETGRQIARLKERIEALEKAQEVRDST